MLKFFAIISSSLIFVYFAFYFFIKAEEHDYQVLKIIDEIEIREYDEMIYASYTPKNESNRSSSFKMIANYIFGGNNANEEISMTSPVVMKPFDNDEMAFIMLPRVNGGHTVFALSVCLFACLYVSNFIIAHNF